MCLCIKKQNEKEKKEALCLLFWLQKCMWSLLTKNKYKWRIYCVCVLINKMKRKKERKHYHLFCYFDWNLLVKKIYVLIETSHVHCEIFLYSLWYLTLYMSLIIYKAVNSCICCRILWYDVVLPHRLDTAKLSFHFICMDDRLFDDHLIFSIKIWWSDCSCYLSFKIFNASLTITQVYFWLWVHPEAPFLSKIHILVFRWSYLLPL